MTIRVHHLAPAFIAALLLAGCGSSGSSRSSSSSSSTSAAKSICPTKVPCITKNPAAQVVGPTNLVDNIKNEMRTGDRELKQVHLTCPVKRVTKFPVRCRLDAIRIGAGRVPTGPVTGTATVGAVYTGTHTYVLQVLYAPTKGS